VTQRLQRRPGSSARSARSERGSASHPPASDR
jgi:hypothetical protein